MRDQTESEAGWCREEPFRLGDWEVIPARHLIRRDGGSTILQPKIMRLLSVLAAAPGETLSRDDLIERVWRGIIVSDAAIDRAVCGLRKALGDEALSPRYVERIRKRGVRLMIEPGEIEARQPPRRAVPQPVGATVSAAPRIAGFPMKSALVAPLLLVMAALALAGLNSGSPVGGMMVAEDNGAPSVLPAELVTLGEARFSAVSLTETCEAGSLFDGDPVDDI